MELFLYDVLESEESINKVLDNPLTIPINLKAETDIINPILLLQSIEGVNFNDYNYCHIPVLERYYFISSVQNSNAKLWRLSCECDVLMTYKNDILNSNARLKRNIKNGDYLNANIDTRIFKTVSITESNVSINEDEKSIILSIVGV